MSSFLNHCLLDKLWSALIIVCLKNFGLPLPDEVNEAVMYLKEYIANSYENSTHQEAFPTPPHKYIITPKEVQKTRQKYCQLSPDGV